jgi:hypothetical protein
VTATAIFGSLAMVSSSVSSIVWGTSLSQTAELLPILLAAVLSSTIAAAPAVSLSSRSRRGIVTTTSASVAGLIAGCLVWLVFAKTYGILAVASGYLVGTTCVAAIVMIVAWRHDKHAWGGLLARTALGYGLLAAGIALQRILESKLDTSQITIDLAGGTAFFLVWAIIAWPEARWLLRAYQRSSVSNVNELDNQ